MVNPIGIDAPSPRLRWILEDNRRGALQKAYQVIVGTDSTHVSQGDGNVWNSQKKESTEMLVTYNGVKLKPFTRYFWTVRIWNEKNKKSKLAKVASFETGMMEQDNWKGSWISDSEDISLKPAPYFRKQFEPSGRIKSARVYIVAAGLYELYVNGLRVGNHRLDPAYTRFDKRNLYVTYDITSMVNSSPVVVGVLLGNGWYNHQSSSSWDFNKAPWRARPKFCLNLRITYMNGKEEIISSGEDWKTSLSPVIFNSIYTGEYHDERLNQQGWTRPGFDDSKWTNAIRVESPSSNIVAQVMHPIREVEEITPVSMNKISNQKYVFDLGRNISGVCRLRVKGESGTSLRLKHGELLSKDGSVDQSNINVHYHPTDNTDPYQNDLFILCGNGVETFVPHFNYKGFQYVEVISDRPIELTKESLTGLFMHSDVPAVGQLSSSNPTLNKLWSATNNSYLSNLFGYPTDCPQREKNGWTGDAHIASETGLYNFDAITIYEKWMADHRDEQQPNGILPSIIPTCGWGYIWGNGPDWTSSIAIIPWNIYQFYGDPKLLADCYENIKRYVDHITEMSPNGLIDWGLGDWVPVKSFGPKELTSSIYYYVDASILGKAAKILGKESDFRNYSALAEKIAKSINDKYLNKETCIYGSGFQTELSAPLFWGIVPEDLRAKVSENLAKRVISDNRHIDVGLLGSKTILNALSENGYADLAYEVAAQEDYPSWGYWIKNGATTLFENWRIEAQSDLSRNHIMFGEIGAWYFKALGGIKADWENPGFRNVLLEPHFVKGLNSFNCSHNSAYGKIVSSWKRKGTKIDYQVTIPANCSARLTLKGSKILEKNKELSRNQFIQVLQNNNSLNVLSLKSGSYRFIIEQ
ncbi:MAG: family 78 glycoside hydrolase catalytic domain [Bacteroidota bacterium]|nr:family 78 glycoside hydrolase catalytic domain [Bacteroidota bacterium]